MVSQIGPTDTVFKTEFSSATSDANLDRLDVAVAYATAGGISRLLGVLGRNLEPNRWVIGLDDAVTHPDALTQALSLDGSEVRIATRGPGPRYHPKIYQLWSSAHNDLGVSYVGSANMTDSGLLRNAEAGVILTSDTDADVAQMRSQWQTMWDIGRPLDAAGVTRYKEIWDGVRAAKKKFDKKVTKKVLAGGSILDIVTPATPANVNISQSTNVSLSGMLQPQNAKTAWTECASPSAGGRDLEFPRKMTPFFRIPQSPWTANIRIGGTVFPLRFTMRDDNQMWRLLFSTDSVFAGLNRQNLRPITGGNRSDIAISFTHVNTDGVDFDANMVTIGSSVHQQFVSQSNSTGVLDSTRNPGGRQFGWF